MRRSKELMVLLVSLLAVMAFVLWYVRARRAERNETPIAEKSVGPVAAPAATASAAPAGPVAGVAATTPTPRVDLEKHDAKTIDFSSGKPVVKDTAEDRAALQQGLKDIEEATSGVTFEPEKKSEPKKP